MRIQKFLVLSVMFFSGFVFAVPQTHALTVPTGFSVTTTVAGLTLPTAFAFAPDGRVFVAQKSGAIREVKNGVLLSTPVVQLADVNDYGDRGVEGIALDPNFSQNGYMYLAYTYENTPGQNYSGPKTGRIVRLTVVGDTASLASKVVILGTVGGDATHPSCMNVATTSDCIASDANTHSMGALHFGPDGKLYASLGDGSGYLTADPEALGAQDVHWLAGKIIRINADGTGPSDNPFYDGNPADNQSKVWALGDRNMYRFNFRPADGTLFIGAVGWATTEAVYIGVKGANYGWPCIEGFGATTYNCAPSSSPTYPIYTFGHQTGTASVMGGVFPSAYPATYAGNYFFGDYSNDNIKRMVLGPNDTVQTVTDFITGAGGPVDFAVGPDGNVWYVALNVGQLRKIVFSSANQPPAAVVSAAPTQGSAPLTVSFSGSGSSDPEQGPLTYVWDFGDNSTGSGVSISHTYQNNGAYTATLTVTDQGGLTAQATANIGVGVAPSGSPAPHLTTASIAPSPVVIGHQETLTAQITNAGDPAPILVDLEIYDANAHQVAQQVFENQIIPKGETSPFTLSWLPPTIGTYTLKVGLFKPGWGGLYEWTDQALSIAVANRAPQNPSFGATTTLSSQALVGGQQQTITASVTDTGGAGSALVDIEVYKDGVKVGQQYFDGQSFDTGQTKNFSYTFSPSGAGTYTVSIGLFQTGWSGLYAWLDTVAMFTVAGSGSTAIYQNALAPGWSDWSWGTSNNFADTLLVAPGSTNALRVSYKQSWAGLYLHTGAANTTGKSSLSFSIAGVNAGGQKLQVAAVDANGAALPFKPLSSYVQGGLQSNMWKQVTIPLTDLSAQNRTITGFMLQDVSGSPGSTVALDALLLQ